MDLSDPKDLASLLEAFLLASGRPLSLERLGERFELPAERRLQHLQGQLARFSLASLENPLFGAASVQDVLEGLADLLTSISAAAADSCVCIASLSTAICTCCSAAPRRVWTTRSTTRAGETDMSMGTPLKLFRIYRLVGRVA